MKQELPVVFCEDLRRFEALYAQTLDPAADPLRLMKMGTPSQRTQLLASPLVLSAQATQQLIDLQN